MTTDPLKLTLPHNEPIEVTVTGTTIHDTTACNIYICFEKIDDGCQEVHNVEFLEAGNPRQGELVCYYRLEVELDQKVLVESGKKDANGDTSFVEFKILKRGVEILGHKFIELPSAGKEAEKAENSDSDSIETPEPTDTELQVETYKFGPYMEIKRTFTTSQEANAEGGKTGKIKAIFHHTHIYKPFSRKEPFLLVD